MTQRTCTVPATAHMFFMEKIVTGAAGRDELQQFVKDCDLIMRFRPTPVEHAEVLCYQTHAMYQLREDRDLVRYQAGFAAEMAKHNRVLYAYVSSAILALTCQSISPAERYERLHEGVSREMVHLDRFVWRCSEQEYKLAESLITGAYESANFRR
ncbi:MAG TPA: hypothetical protein VFO38_00380 [Candidatus Saccharimonadales bacterium]|nr:hypothetical protein [Candidatus Saccharimonadales bacterium]